MPTATGKCQTHLDCLTIGELATKCMRGRDPRADLARSDRLPVTKPSAIEPLTKRHTVVPATLQIVGERTWSLPVGINKASYVLMDNRRHRRDPIWDGHFDEDGNWVKPTYKQTDRTPQTDGLIHPWGDFPAAGRMNRENELQWLIATSTYDPEGLSPDQHVPHDGRCEHHVELATTLEVFRENKLRGTSLNEDVDEDYERLALELGDPDEGFELPSRLAAEDPDDDREPDEYQFITAFGTPLDLPLPSALRQIEHERWSAKHGLPIKFSWFQIPGGDIVPTYWAGWRTPPTTDADGNFIPGVKVRFEKGDIEFDKASPAKQKRLQQTVRDGIRRVREVGVHPADAKAAVIEHRLRREWYGRDYTYSLITPKQVKQLPLQRWVRNWEPDVPEFRESIEDEAEAIWSHVSSPHRNCPTTPEGNVKHTECLDWGEFVKNCPECGGTHYHLDPDIRLPLDQPDWTQPKKASVISYVTVEEYRQHRSERPAFLGGLYEDNTRDVHDPVPQSEGRVEFKPWTNPDSTGELPWVCYLAIFRLKALRVAWLKAGK